MEEQEQGSLSSSSLQLQQLLFRIAAQDDLRHSIFDPVDRHRRPPPSRRILKPINDNLSFRRRLNAVRRVERDAHEEF